LISIKQFVMIIGCCCSSPPSILLRSERSGTQRPRVSLPEVDRCQVGLVHRAFEQVSDTVRCRVAIRAGVRIIGCALVSTCSLNFRSFALVQWEKSYSKSLRAAERNF